MNQALAGLVRLASNYHAPIRRSLQRVVAIEVAEVGAAIEEHLEKRSIIGFSNFLAKYYRYSMPKYMRMYYYPIIKEFMKSVSNQASYYLVGDDQDIEDSTDLQRFISAYINLSIARYLKGSEGQLLSIVDKFKEKPEELSSRLRKRLDEWNLKRAEKVASDEIVRSENAMAMETWIKHGVPRFKWVTNPQSNNCPFCAAMNGITVKAGGIFLDAGETLYVKWKDGKAVAASISSSGKIGVGWLFGDKEHKGKSSKNWVALKSYSVKRHPPIHGGCVCRVAPAK